MYSQQQHLLSGWHKEICDLMVPIQFRRSWGCSCITEQKFLRNID